MTTKKSTSRGQSPAQDDADMEAIMDVEDEDVSEGAPQVKKIGKSKAVDHPKTLEEWWGNWSRMVSGNEVLEPYNQLVKTGLMSFDIAMGFGGLPLGGLMTVYGESGVGKTTLAMLIAGCVQRQFPRKRIVIIDGENKMNPVIAGLSGLTINEELLADHRVMIVRPSLTNGYSYERMMVSLEQLLDPKVSPDGAFILLDSLDSMSTQSEIEMEATDGGVKFGGMAKSNSITLKRLVGLLKATDSTMYMVQQGRVFQGQVAPYGPPPIITSGGKAVEYYSSVRLELRKGSAIKNSDGEITGDTIHGFLIKNNFGRPRIKFDFDLRYDFSADWSAGLDTMSSLLDASVTLGIAKASGKSFELTGLIKKDGGPAIFGNGREATLKWMRANPEQSAALESKVRAHLYGE